MASREYNRIVLSGIITNKTTAREHLNLQKCQEISKLKELSRRILPGSITNKWIAVECCKQKDFQGVINTKGLPKGITYVIIEYNNLRIAREYHNQKYHQEVPHPSVFPVSVTIKRSSIKYPNQNYCQGGQNSK